MSEKRWVGADMKDYCATRLPREFQVKTRLRLLYAIHNLHLCSSLTTILIFSTDRYYYFELLS